MTQSKNTKRALLASVISLMLCVAMLVGSTFAWFTDSVTSSGNIIKSGNLEVEMYWADGTEDPKSADTKWQDASESAIFNNEKWEPSYTEVRHIKISNVGTLALKYDVSIKAEEEVGKLADVIDVYYIKDGKQIADRAALKDADKIGTLAELLKEASVANGHISGKEGEVVSSDIATIAFKMQESAGNEYQGASIGGNFSIILNATQYTEEEDSFGNDYDEDANYYPTTVVSTSTELVNAIKEAVDGSTVALNSDVVLDSLLSISNGIILDLENSIISKKGIDITADNKNIVIKADNGGIALSENQCIKINSKNSNIIVDGGFYSLSGSYDAYFMEGKSGGSNHITIQNVTYKGDRGVSFSQSNNNVIDIKDCTFNTTGYSTIYIGGSNNVCNLENVTINGARILAADTLHTEGEAYSVINIKSGTYSCDLSTNDNCIISVTGGSFSDNPSNYLADGYKAIWNGATQMWDVVAKN